MAAKELKHHIKTHTDFLLSLNCKPKQINLRGIAVDDNSLSNIFREKSLKSIQCSYFFMTDNGWNNIIDSMERARHNLQVSLTGTNINDGSVSKITSNPNFTVVCNDGTDENGVHRFLLFHCHPPKKLKSIRLLYIYLHDSALLITPEMATLSDIYLDFVNMQPSAWTQLIVGLYSIRNEIRVNLEDTNIDDDSASHILESSAFTVMFCSQKSEEGRYERLIFNTRPPYKIDRIEINNVALGDNGIKISDDMKRLHEIYLTSVQMSRKCWREFASSICKVDKRRMFVELEKTNIDQEAIASISSCPNIVMKLGKGQRHKDTIAIFKRFLCMLPCCPYSCIYCGRCKDQCCVWTTNYM